ncbi:MAG: hypothetical protein RDU14_16700 [Melioribacteraceae bacterium]|nr:hypothetical protein [Melioribacteraceae bacterium]
MGLRVIDNSIRGSLQRFGQTYKYYPARLCSCVEENNGNFLPDHTCNHGFYFGTAQTIIVIKTQFNEKFLNSQQGVIFNGGAQFTIPKLNLAGVEQPAWKTIAHGDVLASLTKIRRDTDILLRGTRDKIYAFDVKEVLTVSRGATIYTPITDYTVSEQTFDAGKLTVINWVTDAQQVVHGPATGEAYAVEFTCLHQFKVWDEAAMDRGTDTDDLPRKIKCVLRRFTNPEKTAYDKGVNLNQEIYQ